MMMSLLPPLLIMGVASFVLTRLLLGYLRQRAILDHPNERSSHAVPTPRGGGLAVVVVALAGGCYAGFLHFGQTDPLWYMPLAGAALLAMVSWVDDLRSLSVRLRLLVQLVAAMLMLPWIGQGGGLVFQGLLPVWLEYPLVVLMLAGFVNFFNFMDGIDGISGVETVAVAGGLALLAVFNPSLPLNPLTLGGLAMAAIGFLWWNWHPAKLFLGDVGSVPIGFLLGAALLKLAAAGFWTAALILPLYYLADAVITLLRRALRGEKVWQAHREHFYQRAVRAGRSHARVSAMIALANMVLVGLAVASPDLGWMALVPAVAVVGLLLAWMSRGAPQMARSRVGGEAAE